MIFVTVGTVICYGGDRYGGDISLRWGRYGGDISTCFDQLKKSLRPRFKLN